MWPWLFVIDLGEFLRYSPVVVSIASLFPDLFASEDLDAFDEVEGDVIRSAF